jgi:hypothetical protein
MRTANEQIQDLRDELRRLHTRLAHNYDRTPELAITLTHIEDTLRRTAPPGLELGGGSKITIPVAVLEFYDHGRAIWVHDQNGYTILRVAVRKGVTLSSACENPTAHVDIEVEGPVEVCVPKGALEEYHNESM